MKKAALLSFCFTATAAVQGNLLQLAQLGKIYGPTVMRTLSTAAAEQVPAVIKQRGRTLPFVLGVVTGSTLTFTGLVVLADQEEKAQGKPGFWKDLRARMEKE